MKKKVRRIEEILASSATLWPGNIAVEQGDESINYKDLNHKAGLLADYLNKNLPSKNPRIGLLLPKSIATVISIFGVLKSGGAYVPLDFEAPAKRNSYIAKNCKLDAIITLKKTDYQGFTENFIKHEINDPRIIIYLIDKTESGRNEMVFPELAYILNTSGSTGHPKAVLFNDQNAISFIEWCNNTFEADQNSVFSSHAPFHFDLSILDLFFSVSNGAKLILIDSKTAKNPRALTHLIAEKKITHWYSTPTILKLILNYGKPERYDYSSLKYVLFAGEVFPIEPLRKLTELWPDKIFYNLYGPSETNVCTYFKIPLPIESDQTHPFPIGKVCEHLDAYLLLNQNKSNELCISGPSVCLGYLNEDQKAEHSFFEKNGKRWYKTGDIVTIDKENNFFFMGRADRMIKKNGFRIELDEVENCFHNHPEISDAAVLSLTKEQGEVTIKAFLQKKENSSVSSDVMRNYCLEILPEYMLPDRIQFLGNIPKTSTDKTDYQKLTKE